MKIYVLLQYLRISFCVLGVLACIFSLCGVSQARAEASSDSNFTFLDCKVSRHYRTGERRIFSEDMFLKVDIRNSEVYLFNADRLTYENKCDRIRGRANQLTIGDTPSVCRISSDTVTVSRSAILFLNTSWETYYVYRGSGRIEGTVSLYGGAPTLDIFELGSREPLIDYRINGVCQRGQDMRNRRGVF